MRGRAVWKSWGGGGGKGNVWKLMKTHRGGGGLCGNSWGGGGRERGGGLCGNSWGWRREEGGYVSVDLWGRGGGGGGNEVGCVETHGGGGGGGGGEEGEPWGLCGNWYRQGTVLAWFPNLPSGKIGSSVVDEPYGNVSITSLGLHDGITLFTH